jgi:hypothetical protein
MTQRVGSAYLFTALAWVAGGAFIAIPGKPATAQSPSPTASASDVPVYLADRGPGIATSMFGTYVAPGERLLYPFYEYTRTGSFEYHPSELGHVGEQDYLGRLTERELLLFFSYGISDRLAFEVEGAVHTRARFEKAANDPSTVPARLSEAGLGDVEGQLRWRWRPETADHGELFSFVELVLPSQKDKFLIGTQNWEASIGLGWLRGYPWGTLGARVTLLYDRADPQGSLEMGEFAIDYIKRSSEKWRWVASIEGEPDDLSLIGEAQWLFSRHAFLKINSGFGLTDKAPDVAPEIGVMFHF